MVVILPNSVIGLGYLIRKIKDKPELLNEALRNMTLEEVSVSIPKFDVVETTIDLEELYKTVSAYVCTISVISFLISLFIKPSASQYFYAAQLRNNLMAHLVLSDKGTST